MYLQDKNISFVCLKKNRLNQKSGLKNESKK